MELSDFTLFRVFAAPCRVAVVVAMLALACVLWPGAVTAQHPTDAPAAEALPGPEPGAPAPAPAAAPAAPAATPKPSPTPTPAEPGATVTPTPTPIVFENVPVSTLWQQYREAVKLIDAGDPQGVAIFARLLSSEDLKWLQSNMPALIDLLSSGTIGSKSPDEKNLFVLQALLRNMPHDIAGEPKFYRRVGSPYGLAKVTDSSTTPSKVFLTMLYQEGGRWVLYHPFFARDFVWVPQLAYYKKLKGRPNAPEEAEYLRNGFAPFTEWALSYYRYCGYVPGEETRGKSSTP